MQTSGIIIKTTDFNTIKSLIDNIPAHQRTKEVDQLLGEILQANIVKDDEIDENIIQLNSFFEIEEFSTKKHYSFTLTLPSMSNIADKKLSILTPLGVALIGFRLGMEIEWQLPGGRRKMTILKVTKPVLSNQ